MNVIYIGFIGVKQSMRSLTHLKRSELAKESISRLCEANNIPRTADKKRLCDDSLLDEQPNLQHSGTEVQLCVTSTHLQLISNETNQVIIQHEMPNVSFASSGDEDTVDFVGYVAKDDKYKRACFVLKCGCGSAKTVLDTIARQFQLRTQQILYNSSTLSRTNSSITHDRLLNFNDEQNSLECKVNNENQRNDSSIALTRATLEKESWFHGSYLSREASETRLKQNGDFLVRESMLDPGNFVLSVMHDGEKLHLLFDSIGIQVRTKTKIFDDISHLVRYHHDEGTPIVADNRVVFLRNGVVKSMKF